MDHQAWSWMTVLSEDHREDCFNTAYNVKQGAWLKMGVGQGDSKKDILLANARYARLEV